MPFLCLTDVLLPCTTNQNEPGFVCGSKCRRTEDWCRSWNTQVCEKKHINTNDKRVCGNPLVWKMLSCIEYYNSNLTIDFMIKSYGLRCIGKNMECVKPWYTSDDGSSRAGWGWSDLIILLSRPDTFLLSSIASRES